MTSRKWKFIIPAIGIVGALTILIGVGVGDSGGFAYYLTVGEYLEQRPDAAENLRINGKVADGSIALDPSGITASFVITDGTASMPVTYRGPASDSLADGADVVIEGAMNADGTFVARDMLAKCPSKYQSRGEEHPDDVARRPGNPD